MCSYCSIWIILISNFRIQEHFSWPYCSTQESAFPPLQCNPRHTPIIAITHLFYALIIAQWKFCHMLIIAHPCTQCRIREYQLNPCCSMQESVLISCCTMQESLSCPYYNIHLCRSLYSTSTPLCVTCRNLKHSLIVTHENICHAPNLQCCLCVVGIFIS